MKQARPADAVKILQLYFDIYGGSYPDPRMTDFLTLNTVLNSEDYLWIVEETADQIVGSVVYQIDTKNKLAKAFGAVVRPEMRGHALTEKLMTYGHDILVNQKHAIEVIYATTRTVSFAPQKLTRHLGYKKLGIFPNIHRTVESETHALTAAYTPQSLQKRFTDFQLHPKLARLYSIVQKECELQPLKIENLKTATASSSADPTSIDFEAIQAPKFVRHQFSAERDNVKDHHWFFPFIEPNLMLTNEDSSIHVFVNFSNVDQYCAIIAIRDINKIGYKTIFESACKVLRGLGVRYMEFIIRADESAKIDTAFASRFIPCAYFPAMQLEGAQRFDYVVFSRSFEILDFKGLKFEGVNKDYLQQYYSFWEETAYESVFID